ncbi:MAG: NUDIX domain-containing protein [bacterium]
MIPLEDGRATLRPIIAAHVPADAAEARDQAAMLAFIDAHADCLGRTNPLGHFTGSALVFDPAGRLLLLWHRKLERWLQPGGHSEPEEHDPIATALREAHEETGLTDLAPLGVGPLDLDIHRIPGRGDEAAHDHLDVRYALLTRQPEAAMVSVESRELRWFGPDALGGLGLDAALWRAVEKGRRRLADAQPTASLSSPSSSSSPSPRM